MLSETEVKIKVLWRRISYPQLLVLLCCILAALFVFKAYENKTRRPNIVFILADDLGYNDLGWVRSQDFEEIRTPYLDSLAEDALQLDYAYVQPICSASRAALLTGRYPFRYGYQRTAIGFDEVAGLDQKLFPQQLQQLGYQTHLVGKWHLGFCRKEYTPLYKGFDTFRGYLGGNEHYYEHVGLKKYYDYWHNERIYRSNEYSTLDYGQYTEELIMNNTDSRPMFLYLAMQAPHMPYNAPPGVDENADDEFKYRKIVEVMDMYVGQVYRALTKKGMIDNTIFVFASDNGAATHGGSNFPLRGFKQDLFDGGTRVRAFVRGPGIPSGTYNGFFHITDWYPTIMKMAGGSVDPELDLDGVDQYDALLENRDDYESHPRQHIVYDINERRVRNGTRESGAIRLRTLTKSGSLSDYKFIYGEPGPSEPSIYSPEGLLFDMTQSENERQNLRGYRRTKRKLRRLLDAVQQKGYKKREPVYSEDAFTQTDENGRPIFAPGWC